MEVPPVGNRPLHAATFAAQKQKESSGERAAPSVEDAKHEEAPGRTQEDLEQLADSVLAVFDDAPERLEALVATLKQLEAANKAFGSSSPVDK